MSSGGVLVDEPVAGVIGTEPTGPGGTDRQPIGFGNQPEVAGTPSEALDVVGDGVLFEDRPREWLLTSGDEQGQVEDLLEELVVPGDHRS